jgi:hypothetical protein
MGANMASKEPLCWFARRAASPISRPASLENTRKFSTLGSFGSGWAFGKQALAYLD